MSPVTIFYAGMVWGEYEGTPKLYDLPDGIYIYYRDAWPGNNGRQWFLKDLTPVLDSDVPNTLRVFLLLL